MEITWVTLIEIFLVVFVLGALMNLVFSARYVFFGQSFPRIFIWRPSDFWPKWAVAVWAVIFLVAAAYLLVSFIEDMSSRGIFLFGIGENGLAGIFSFNELNNFLLPWIGGG